MLQTLIGANLNAQESFEIISRYHCIAQFSLDGTILSANDKFLSTFEYTYNELIGQLHRRLLVDPNRPDPDYDRMWSGFSDGIARSGEILRRTKSGKVVWLQAVYCPVAGTSGSIVSTLKIASVKTAELVDAGINAPLTKLA
ncbi:MAG: PAS domain-containing protein [Pseudomonadota bacterium]